MIVFTILWSIILQTWLYLLVAIGVSVLTFFVIEKIYRRKVAWIVSIVLCVFLLLALWPKLMPGRGRTFGPAAGPTITASQLLSFIKKVSSMERVKDIARDPADVPPSITRTTEERVTIEITAKEVIGTMADGVTFNYWTFDGTVPGPFLRVREGDTVELTLHNDSTSVHDHNIDLHAVTGPGGGASVTNVKPGESKTVTFKALNPGLYVYHCAHPNVATHMAHGMYGLILVEPKGGLPKVDKEFAVVQGEFYSTGKLGKRGLQIFDAQKMLDGQPQYIVWNGRVNGAVDKMNVKTGERVRLYVGNGGVNLVSSFHVIGEIFDTVYPEAALGPGSAVLRNVQTTLVPAGGASIVEFLMDVPGKYILVDHALARLDRGAWGTMEATGDEVPEIFSGSTEEHQHSH